MRALGYWGGLGPIPCNTPASITLTRHTSLPPGHRAQRRIRQHHVETEFLARMALTDPEQHSRGKDLRRVGHNAYRDRKMRELGYETVPDASAVR